MRKTLVLLDCDGPMANFVGGFLDAIEEETGERFGSAVVTEWTITDSPFFAVLARDRGEDPQDLASRIWKRVNRIGFCANLKPIPGLDEALDALRVTGAAVECVTSPLVSSPTWMPERAEWLRRHGFRNDQIHFVSAKHRVPGDFLVDDKPSHVRDWMEATRKTEHWGFGMLWDAPYNTEGYGVVELDDGSTRGHYNVRVGEWGRVIGCMEYRIDKEANGRAAAASSAR